ncbi:MAG TPA: ATP-dependent helicase HrpB, partial [Opitutaceae bacterium]
LLAALRGRGRVVIQAPTGSGKSTQVPQMILSAGLLVSGQAVVLQPRRLAARMLARRVAEEVGCPLGDTVGYQIRLESKVSDHTRIRFVTEGILLRQMTFDPDLRGVAAVVFDEFHERHLYGDISLARALRIQKTSRPDLRIIVMSATLQAASLREYLAPCDMLESKGRTFPVRIEYLPKAVDSEAMQVWDVAARECERAAGETGGDMLVFMPGSYEIGRTIQAVQGLRSLRGFAALPLHGELPVEAQDRAVARAETRKIIVSTNVAETSLTIDGVTAVIDSGLARVARFDPARGINTLLVEDISVASADQRAGRAGRTAPGVCVRLWTEREHGHRAAHELPEVKRLDLSEVVLTLKAAGVTDLAAFEWFEKPDPRGLAQAESVLSDLGALAGSGGAITEVGRRMLRFPVHPRYARMFLEAERRGCVRPVAMMAALTQGRGFLIRNVPKQVEQARDGLFGEEHESDFFILMRAWRYADKNRYSLEACRALGIHAQSARQVGPLFEQFLEIATSEGLDTAEKRTDGTEVRKCVLAGFPDHLAHRLDSTTLRCDLVHNRRGLLARESAIKGSPLFVAAEITEVGGRAGEVSTILAIATAVEEEWLRELFPGDFKDVREVTYDTGAKRVLARRERRFRDLVLESRNSEDVPENESADLLAKEVISGRIKIDAWDEAAEQWMTRVNRMAEWFPEYEVNPIGDADRKTLIEQVCYGETTARGVKGKEVMPVLRDWLTPEQLAAMDLSVPERLTMVNGRRSKITYGKEGPPVLSARIQELYGIEGRFSLGRGRVPVKIEVLAPNQRPIQVTDDLTTFWREIYPRIKPELSRRYPRHEWR